MKKLKHTINIALGLNIAVLDDQGQPIEAFIFPVAYLVLSLPGLLYRWLHLAARSLSHICSILGPGGWREDLQLMATALAGLWQQRRAYV